MDDYNDKLLIGNRAYERQNDRSLNIEVPYFTNDVSKSAQSFCARKKNDNSYPDKEIRQHDDEYSYKRTKDGDVYCAKNEKSNAQKQRERDIRNRMIGAIAALAIAAGGTGAVNVIKGEDSNFVTSGHTLEQVAEWTDVDAAAILYANGLEEGEELPEELFIPEKYDPYGEKIEKYEKDLEGIFVTKSKRKELETKISLLKRDKKKAEEIAAGYKISDTKILFVPAKENVTAKELKDAYRIDDGALKRCNDLTPRYGTSLGEFDAAYIPEEGVYVRTYDLF